MSILYPNKLLQSGLSDTKEFLEVYAKNFNDVFSWIKEYEGVKHDYYFNEIITEQNTLRFLLVFSDLINLYPKGIPPEGCKIRECNLNEFSDRFQISLPVEIIDKFEMRNGQMNLRPSFLIFHDEVLRKQVDFLKPILNSNRAVLHSSRIIVGEAKSNEFPPNVRIIPGQRHWLSYDIKPESPIDNWLVYNNARSVDSIKVSFSHQSLPNTKELTSITVPYLQNLSFSNLIKILEDNHDELVIFRAALKKLVNEALVNGKDVIYIKNELVDPAISRLNLVFDQVKKNHRKKISFSVGKICLSLLSLHQGFQTLAGAFGLGHGLSEMLKSEEEYWNEQEKLRTNDFYLLWKLKNSVR